MVVIHTATEKIEGTAHVLSDSRLLDLLNRRDDNFIPISDAKLFDLKSGQLLFSTNFLAVNKNQVILIAEDYSLPD